MRRQATRGLAILAVALAGTTACRPAVRSPNAPYLMRIEVSGDLPQRGPIEECVDPALFQKAAAALAKARPANAPPPLTGCTQTREKRPDGSTHSETVCDRAKGARMSYRMTTDGTAGDMRMHRETYGFDPITGAPKTRVSDTHMVRLGACPPDLKPGEMRMPNGTVVDIAKLRAGLVRPPGSAPPMPVTP